MKKKKLSSEEAEREEDERTRLEVQEAEHSEGMERVIELRAERAPPRGTSWQEPRRSLEAQVREAVVRHTRYALLSGDRVRAVAKSLSLSERTLHDWRSRVVGGESWSRTRGRPLKRATAEERSQMLAHLSKHGPGIGRSLWKTLWPAVARGEARETVERFRRVYAQVHPLELEALRWLRPGTVWAMDHTESKDGSKQPILSVRDLASGKQLAWQIVESADAASTLAILKRLAEEHGLPLVLKSDNGPAFIAELLTAWLQETRVTHLLSPPYWPTYNGAVERAGGTLKERTMWTARDCESWTEEHLEAARLASNELPRMMNPAAASPDQLWAARQPITEPERSAFLAHVDEERAQALAETKAQGKDLDRRTVKAAVERTAIRRALVALGFLRVSRRTIPLPKRRVMCARIL